MGPETILKRRKRQAENRALRAKEAVKSKVARKAKRADIFKRAEKFAKEYQDQERDEIRLRREARKEGNYYVPGDPKLAFVMRIRGINQVSPKVSPHPRDPVRWTQLQVRLQLLVAVQAEHSVRRLEEEGQPLRRGWRLWLP